MKNSLFLLIALGLAFAGQIVNVGETTAGTTSVAPPAGDSECYNEYAQCLRDGCAAAQGTFSEQTQGCYGGNEPAFAKAVGECADAQGECVMGLSSGSSGSGSRGTVPVGGTTGTDGTSQGGLCPAAFALAFLLMGAYASAKA